MLNLNRRLIYHTLAKQKRIAIVNLPGGRGGLFCVGDLGDKRFLEYFPLLLFGVMSVESSSSDGTSDVLHLRLDEAIGQPNELRVFESITHEVRKKEREKERRNDLYDAIGQANKLYVLKSNT